jgi:hypothetical protein
MSDMPTPPPIPTQPAPPQLGSWQYAEVARKQWDDARGDRPGDMDRRRSPFGRTVLRSWRPRVALAAGTAIGGLLIAATFVVAGPLTEAEAQNCDPNYLPCIPNTTGNALNCSDIDVTVRVIGIDHNKFDQDGDGIGCEGNNTTPPAAPVAQTATAVPPTATAVPPTAAPVPPTATAVPPTAAPVPPTATAVPPTAAPVPPTATAVPVATFESESPDEGQDTESASSEENESGSPVVGVLVLAGVGAGAWQFNSRRKKRK